MYSHGENPKSVFGISSRGLLMGFAEVVPGVSGGTIAFVTGIYRDLVGSLASFGLVSLTLLTRPRAFAEHHNLRFLLSLLVGMGLGIFALANVIDLLLTFFRPVVWAFFAGVVAASALTIGRFRDPRKLLIWAPAGALIGFSMVWLPPPGAEAANAILFAGAALAVCAWLLPAISGSYVLLALGIYHPVMRAIADLDFSVLAVVAAGCLTGLLAATRGLAWLLRRHTEALLCFLTGIVVGSLPRLWPWQDDTEATLAERLLTPLEYRDVLGEPSLAYVLIAFATGALLLRALSTENPFAARKPLIDHPT